jgi:hypothetical protein
LIIRWSALIVHQMESADAVRARELSWIFYLQTKRILHGFGQNPYLLVWVDGINVRSSSDTTYIIYVLNVNKILFRSFSNSRCVRVQNICSRFFFLNFSLWLTMTAIQNKVFGLVERRCCLLRKDMTHFLILLWVSLKPYGLFIVGFH